MTDLNVKVFESTLDSVVDSTKKVHTLKGCLNVPYVGVFFFLTEWLNASNLFYTLSSYLKVMLFKVVRLGIDN